MIAISASFPHRLARPAALDGPPMLHPAERGVVGLAFALLATAAMLSVLLDQRVAWFDLLAVSQFGLAAIAFGMVAHARATAPRLALGLVVIGLYLVTTPLVLVLSYMRFPLGGGTIDPLLERADAWLGYSWPAAVALAADHLWFGHLLGWMYRSSILQLVVVAMLLAALGLRRELHRMMLVSAIALLACISIWAAAPSFGPSMLHVIPPEVERALDLATTADGATELRRLSTDGPGLISAKRLGGNVGFPSFHIVMALMAVRFTRRTRLAPLALAANLLLIPATLVHGGHHLMDLLGGAAVFALALALAHRLVPGEEGGGEPPPRSRHIPSEAL